LTHTFTGTWTRTAGTLHGGTSILRLGSDVSGTGGIFTPGTGTVNFKGNGAYTIPALSYYNLDLTNAIGTLFPIGTVSVSGAFIPGSIPSPSQGTINFNGSAQSVPAFEYYNLDLTGASAL